MPNLTLHSNIYYSVSYVLMIPKYETHKEVKRQFQNRVFEVIMLTHQFKNYFLLLLV